MATKAAKSLTINATKFELANALAVENGKLQLKAKDVVLAEVDLPRAKKVSFSILQPTNRVDILDQSGVGYGTLPGAGAEIDVDTFISNISDYIPTGGELVINGGTEDALQVYCGKVTVWDGAANVERLEIRMYTQSHTVKAQYDIESSTWFITVT